MQPQIEELQNLVQNKTPQEVIKIFLEKFGDKIAFSSSLGAEDQVIIDMISKIDKSANIFTLDTGRVFPETYDLIDRTTKRYKISIKIYFPDYSQVEKMVQDKGINLFFESIENRKQCCHIRKMEPLKRAFKSLDVWICGLRRDQSITRTDVQVVEWDEANGLIKLNPIVDWTEDQVWDYIKTNKVPYNLLHDKGFPSVGCQPCTRAIVEGEDLRAGRWWWENPETKECGLHAK
ncbi:MAG: phosphoadenylyl-sulfate reductase [Bacteroidales bacterium]|jgi:phosphoadenosine phosphosulfate reductase|nr:phosphoadenylyl-sulfate reductase [Bacteroidales bacterium]